MYIFLDIDGILNTKSDWKNIYKLQKKNIDALCRDFPNSKIILISSWKNGFISSNNPNNSTPISELENLLTNGVRIIGKTTSSRSRKRNEEINAYIKEHPSILEYIILDDDETEYDDFFLKDKHLKLIDCQKGYI